MGSIYSCNWCSYNAKNGQFYNTVINIVIINASLDSNLSIYGGKVARKSGEGEEESCIRTKDTVQVHTDRLCFLYLSVVALLRYLVFTICTCSLRINLHAVCW